MAIHEKMAALIAALWKRNKVLHSKFQAELDEAVAAKERDIKPLKQLDEQWGQTMTLSAAKPKDSILLMP